MTSARPLVLVVDDTPTILDVVRTCLEEEGYRVSTCLQAPDAIPMASRERPDAIMLDIVMPEMSGWEILATLRADPLLTTIPVIISTAYVAETLGRLEELRGPDGSRALGLLPKPFDLEELLEVVGSLIPAGPPRGTPD